MDSKSAQRELKYLEEKEFSPRYVLSLPQSLGVSAFFVSVVLIKPVSSAKPSAEPKSVLRKGGAPSEGDSLHYPDLIIVTLVAS